MENIIKINFKAVIVTGLVAFVLSLAWYSPILFGDIWMKYRTGGDPVVPGWTMLFAPVRELIATYVLAVLITRLELFRWQSAVRFALLLWLAFQAVGMAGAVMWDHMPWQLGLVHAGDWLMKMLFMSVVLSKWHR